VSGDRGLQDAGYPANLFLFMQSTGRWSMLVDETGTAGIARPHADTRAIVLDSAAAASTGNATVGKLLMATDGGVWRLDLSTSPRTWTSLNGTAGTTGGLRISELLSLSFDQLNAVLLGGAQDNGSFEQPYTAVDRTDSNNNGLIDDAGETLTWLATSPFGGDGNGSGVIPVV